MIDLKTVSFKIEEDLLDILEELARRRNTTKSEVIRRALRQYIMSRDDRPFITKRIKIWT